MRPKSVVRVKTKLKPPPPCPDPMRYTLVRTKYGDRWRLKRGLGKPAVLNEGMQAQSDAMKESMPAAKRILTALLPYTKGFSLSYTQVQIGNRLAKELRAKAYADYLSLMHFDLQLKHPLSQLLTSSIEIQRKKRRIELGIKIHKGGSIKAPGRMLTEYFFSAILLCGDPLDPEEELETYERTSPLYPIKTGAEDMCRLELPLPGGDIPWMLLLKAECLEGKNIAVSPRSRAMKVVGMRNFEGGERYFVF